MCGATDCRSCGPAQGYEVRRIWTGSGYKYVNPDPEEEEDEDCIEEDEDE